MSTKLIDQVIEQIKKDIANEDMTAIEEMLTHVGLDILIGYLPE